MYQNSIEAKELPELEIDFMINIFFSNYLRECSHLDASANGSSKDFLVEILMVLVFITQGRLWRLFK